ncbi:uncharacterized protein LOC115774195, partial [Tachysurus ichikawai]
MFEIIGVKKDSWRMRCKLWQPKKQEMLAFKNSPSNLRKHIQRKHTNHLERYTQITSTALKRRSSDEGPSSKQMKLWETKRVSQHSIDEAIVNFVIQVLHPLCVVEQEGFKSLVHLLQPSVAVMSLGTVKNKVQKATQEMKNNLKAAMSEIEFIATTTDCWTAHRQGFIGGSRNSTEMLWCPGM